MQPYQSFYPNQMTTPYQNNFNQPMPMQNSYLDRMNQLQNYQQVLQQPQVPQQPIGLSCRIVDDFNSITANDVPMDGNGAIFMKRGGSQLQWRNWAANGTIITTSYLPDLEQNQQESTNMPQNDFTVLNEDVRALREEILSRLDNIEKSITKPAASRVKKGESENE